MQTPLCVRPLTADERATLETGLRSASAFTVRRCQMLLASAEGQPTTTIAQALRCTDQTVRNAIHAFHQRALAVLQPQSSRPHTMAVIFDAGACESLQALLHQSPRTFGQPTSLGFAVFLSGMCLAAIQNPKVSAESPVSSTGPTVLQPKPIPRRSDYATRLHGSPPERDHDNGSADR